jgi:hypothetical protein
VKKPGKRVILNSEGDHKHETNQPATRTDSGFSLDGCPLNAEGFSTAVDGLVIES